MRTTYTRELASGLEVEFRRMMSIHQEWLSTGKTQKSTKSKTNKSDKNIDDVFADILVSIGGVDVSSWKHESKLELVGKMLSTDFSEAILAARFFSVDRHFAERQQEYEAYLIQLKLWELGQKLKNGEISEEIALAEAGPESNIEHIISLADDDMPVYESQYEPHIFSFNYTWKDKDDLGNLVEVPFKYEMPIHFHDFEFKAPAVKSHKLLSDEEKNNELVLPISGEKVRWSMLDIKMENIMRNSIKPESFHVNTPIILRNPVRLEPKQGGGVIPIKLNTSKMELIDIEELRKDIFTKEGKADTSITIQHPEKDITTKVDILKVVTFFIPSGVA